MRFWRGAASALAVGACALAVGCGGGDEGSGPVTLNFWSYDEPGGSFRDAAERCSEDADGRYRIAFNALGNDPNSQRQALVRRLAAGDSSIDLLSMDVIWTAEFAEAEWVLPWPQDAAAEVTEGTLTGPVESATYEGRLFAAPANSNTQLLWYRRDLVPRPPQTWDEMIDMAAELDEAGRIEVQGAQYEGTTVWFNSLIQSAGGEILDGPDTVALPEGPTVRALEVMRRLGTSGVANPAVENAREDQTRLAFQSGDAAFQINYPFIYASAQEEAPEFVERIGWTTFPRVDADKVARPPVGGFNWGVGAFTDHPEEAFDAAACMRDERNQRAFALDGGLPPTLESLYDDPAFEDEYPFADEIRDSLDNAAVRPPTPLYADVSNAIYRLIAPPGDIGDPAAVAGQLRDRLEAALESRGLF